MPASEQYHRQVLVHRADSGAPEPEIPICPRCGQRRGDVLVIEEVVVGSREEAAAMLEQMRIHEHAGLIAGKPTIDVAEHRA